MGLLAAGETKVLDALLTGVYVALYNGDPEGAGNEVAGGSYARQPYPYTLTGTNPKTAANNAVIQFPVATAGWGQLTHFGIFSAAAAGTLLAAGPLASSKTIDTDDVARFPVGSLKVAAN